jgi:hypothetical protein
MQKVPSAERREKRGARVFQQLAASPRAVTPTVGSHDREEGERGGRGRCAELEQLGALHQRPELLHHRPEEEEATAGWSGCSDLDLEQLAAPPRKGSSPPRAARFAGEGSGGDAEGEEQVASTAELHREEAEAEKRRAADLAVGARLLRLAWMEATGWRALLLLLAPTGAGREARRAGGVRGRWEATSFFCFFFLDWRRGTWRAAEMQKAPTPRECGMPEASAHFAGD